MSRNNIGWKILSLFLALVLIAGAIVGVVFWQKGNIIFKPVEETEQGQPNTEDDSGAVIGEGESDGINLMSAKIAREDYAANGISEQAETAYQLTATIAPESATNKAVDWTIAFVNAASEWATGKTVTDYVTVTPTSDGSLTANVECKHAFGEQIEVTVSVRDDTSVTASCCVDYAQKAINGAVGFYDIDSVLISSDLSSAGDTFVVPAGCTGGIVSPYASWSLSDVYTIEDEFVCTYAVKGTQQFVDILNTEGDFIFEPVSILSRVCTNSSRAYLQFDRGIFTENPSSGLSGYQLYDLGVTDDVGTSYGEVDKAMNLLRAYANVYPVAEVAVSVEGEYSSYTFSVFIKANPAYFAISVSDVALDKDQMVF